MKTIVTILSAALALTASAAFADGDSYYKDGDSYYSGGGDSYYKDGDSYSYGKKITLIHMGDIHGHLVPRPNLRSDGDGRMEGGLARMYTKIRKIRDDHPNSLLINTGDTTQGSGEAMYSRGQAMLDVIDMFGVDAFAPGNWEYVYGPARFEEEFGDGTGKWGKGNRWGALASNLYKTFAKDSAGYINDPNAKDPAFVDSTNTDGKIPASLPRVHTSAQYDAWAQWYLDHGDANRILKPYTIKYVNDLKVGIVGCTTRRGPQVVGKWVVEGIEFTDCAKEVPKYVKEVRAKGADLVVLITEIEVGANIQMVSTFDSLDGDNHIDVILNSDMHEEAIRPIEVPNKSGTAKTLLLEEGQDGTMLGEIELTVRNKKVVAWDHKAHRIHDGISEDYYVAKKVKEVRAPYTTKFAYYASNPDLREKYHKNPFGNTYLNGSLDEIVGTTEKALHRSGYTDEKFFSNDPDAMPAAIEGTSHDWIADAIRWWAHSDLATVRGFRYGTHVKPGPIMRNDLYHFVPIGARVGKAGKIHANQLRNQVDNSSLSVFSTDPMNTTVLNSPYNNEGWAGGWMFAYSGPNLKFDPYWVRRGPKPPAFLGDTNVYPGDSRSRDITVTMTCDRLPSKAVAPETKSERTKCEESGLGKAETHINQDNESTAAIPGNWTDSWNQNKYAITNDNNDIYHPTGGGTIYRDLVIDEKTGVWSSKPGPWNHNKFHHSPVMEVAGYYFEKSPYTLNNCPNCNPRGYSDVVPGQDLPADAAYLLPVNMDPATGRAMLDANGRPVLETENGHTKWVDGHPVVAGAEIDLTMILEKYLAGVGAEGGEYSAYDMERGRGNANPVAHRVSLKKDLPGRDKFGGMPMMQPLCGVVASYFSKADPDTTWGKSGTPEFGARQGVTDVPACPGQ